MAQPQAGDARSIKRSKKCTREAALMHELRKNLKDDDPFNVPLVDSQGRFIMSMALMKLLALAPKAMQATAMQDPTKLPEIAAKAKAFLMGRLNEHAVDADGNMVPKKNSVIRELMHYMLDGAGSPAVDMIKGVLDEAGVDHGIRRLPEDDGNSLGRAIDITSHVVSPGVMDGLAAYAGSRQAKVDALERKVAEMMAEIDATKREMQIAGTVLEEQQAGWGAQEISDLVRNADLARDTVMYDYLIQYNMASWREEMLKSIPPRAV